MDILCELQVIGMHEENNAIVMEVSTCKGEHVLKVVPKTLIPLKNNRLGNNWHGKFSGKSAKRKSIPECVLVKELRR